MSVYLHSVWMFIKCDMEYKISFILTMLGSVIGTFLVVLGTIFLLQEFGSVRWLDDRRSNAYNWNCSIWSYFY